MESHARQDDRVRVAELYARHSEELLGFMRSMVPIAKADASDLLQKVFVEILGWMSRNPGIPIESPRGFVYQVARRHLLKYRERLHRTPTRQTDDEADPHELLVTAEDDDLEYLAAQGAERSLLLRAMRRLGGEQGVDELQVVVYLRFWAGLTESDVGRVLGLKRGAVIRRLRRALSGLREQVRVLEAGEPKEVRTSTEVLRRWWGQLEREAGKGREGLDVPM